MSPRHNIMAPVNIGQTPSLFVLFLLTVIDAYKRFISAKVGAYWKISEEAISKMEDLHEKN